MRGKGRGFGKQPGKVPEPWYHKARAAWYAYINGRNVYFATDLAEAVLKLEGLISVEVVNCR